MFSLGRVFSFSKKNMLSKNDFNFLNKISLKRFSGPLCLNDVQATLSKEDKRIIDNVRVRVIDIRQMHTCVGACACVCESGRVCVFVLVFVGVHCT